MARRLPDDWYPGVVPDNVVLGDGAILDTSYALRRYYSQQQPGLTVGAYADIYGAASLVVGESGVLSIGRYAILDAPHVYCVERVEIGDRVMIAWATAIMDSHCLPPGRERAAAIAAALADQYGRLPAFLAGADRQDGAPVVIEDDVWIGFGSIVLPGVRIGAGSVIGARSVVTHSIPPGVVAVGNPARVVKDLSPSDRPQQPAAASPPR